MSEDVISSLSDDAWINIHHHLSALGEAIQKDLERKPTSKEFFEILSWALGHTRADFFEDAAPGSIAKITAKLHTERHKIRPGTVIGVPGPNSQLYAIIYLTSSTFGDAFGTFPGNKLPELPSHPDQRSEVGRAVYSTFKPVRKGEWKILGSRPDLIPYFPRDPEIYHSKSYHNKENPEIGEFGSAEAPDGKLRDVDKAEAEAIGLLNNTYTQVLLEDELIKFLKEQQK